MIVLTKRKNEFEVDINNRLITIILILLLVSISFFVGKYFGKNYVFNCHIDKGDIDYLYSFIGSSGNVKDDNGEHVFGRYVFNSTSVSQLKYMYDSYYPYSNAILEQELNWLCR